MSAQRLAFPLMVLPIFAVSCNQHDASFRITQAVAGAEKIILFEGLPHQYYEPKLLEAQRRTKATREIHGYPFYKDPLALKVDDARALSKDLGAAKSYKPFSGEKKCGGFHPDYAVALHVNEARYHVLICYGCREAKLFGPQIDARHDLERTALARIQAILKAYRKNRPEPKRQP